MRTPHREAPPLTGARFEQAPSAELLTPAFVALILVNLAFSFSVSTFFLLPKFLALELGAGAREIGAVTGAFGGAMIVALPLVGRLLDGTRNRAVLCAGCALMAASALGFTLVTQLGAWAFVLRGLQGLALSMVNNAASVMVADRAPPHRLAQALGLYAGTGMVMTAVAPALAEVLAARLGFGTVFLSASVAACAAAALSLRIDAQTPVAALPSSMRQLLRSRRVLQLLLVFSCAGLGFGAMMTFSTPFALELGVANVRGFFVAFAVGAASVRFGLGRMMDRVGHQRVAIGALAAYGPVIAAMSMLSSLPLALLGGVLGMAHGLFIPSFMAFAMAGGAKHENGKLLTLLHGGFNLGNAAVAVLGLGAERFGYVAVFLATGTLVLVAPLGLVTCPKSAPT